MAESSSSLAKRHIHDIRTQKFSIGRKDRNPLTNDLHHAVVSLSRELYTKDVHFLMELIQNAEDNEYGVGVEPKLELVLTDKDLTCSGSPATLLVFNNEIGFTKEDMDSICSVGLSTKKGKRNQGYIGEKGIGFKSVFLVSKMPHIFSNGYQVRFKEEPDKDCGIGYIVPEWIYSRPSLLDIHKVYGLGEILPTTTIILPLRPEKVDAVKTILSEVHPEILLFMSKIKRLSVRENNSSSCRLDSISAISISSETELPSTRNANENSRLVLLSLEEESPDVTEATCNYFIWKKAFPVKPENMIDERKDINEWEISIVFPYGKRLHRGTSSVGIFAFMPTAMTTKFPFIIQADFILSTSRETILLDNKWNLGILDCVPSAFVCAFISYIKAETIRPPSFVRALKFLPIQASSVREFCKIRQSIRTLLQEQETVPCASFCGENTVFCEPRQVIRIFPEFRGLIMKMKGEDVPLSAISSQGKYILHSSLDLQKYDDILRFLVVRSVDDDYSWYGKCIKDSNLLSRASASVYVELLVFLAHKWTLLPKRSVKFVPLLKYVTWNGEIASCNITKIKSDELKICCFWEFDQHVWLSKWNLELGCPSDTFFLPDSVMTQLLSREDSCIVRDWLRCNSCLVFSKMLDYFLLIKDILCEKKDRKRVISFSHLLFHAYSKEFIGVEDLYEICRSIPIVDASGKVNVEWTKTLVPSKGSKWIKIFSSHSPFSYREENATSEESVAASQPEKYVEIGDMYAKSAQHCGEVTPTKELLTFIIEYTGAVDLPDICPPNVSLQEASAELRSDQGMLLLNWINSLRSKNREMPRKFIESIQNGKWMKTCSGFNSPNQCFLLNKADISADLVIEDISRILPVIDQEFYVNEISKYKEELICIGVRVTLEHACNFISERLVSLPSSEISKECLHLLLMFMKFSRGRNECNESLTRTLKGCKWMRTNMGYTIPVGSVFLSSESTVISQITCLPIVDTSYYGSWIANYVSELKLLGVVVDLEGARKLVVDNLKLPDDLSTLSRESILFLLECIKRLGPAAAVLTQKMMIQPLMRTSVGLKCPTEAILFDREWSHFLPDFSAPLIDETFYGNEILSFTAELKEIGVAVNLQMATEMISLRVKSLASCEMLTSADVVSLLKCIRCMRVKDPALCWKFRLNLLGEKWLKTRHGYRHSWSAILSDANWESFSQVADLPLIDDAFYGSVIYDFREELHLMKVIVDIKDGAPFVTRSLKLPKDPSAITADAALSLLQCIPYLPKQSYDLEAFVNRLRARKWLKTSMGYRNPEECILRDPEWKVLLQLDDAPFIDEKFYNKLDSLGKDPLKAIGVKVEVEESCILISKALLQQNNSSAIIRIYRFLSKFKWCPRVQDQSEFFLWIPSQINSSNGKWVNREACVLYNKDTLLDSRLHALENYYDTELLVFFSSAFAVKEVPTIKDYINIWKDWESGNNKLTLSECRSFWEYMIENWCLDMEEILQSSVTKIPVTTISGAGLQLVDKEEVFIPDDLHLKQLFLEASDVPLFVWCSQSTLPSLRQNELYRIYTALGVGRISESVTTSVLSLPSDLSKIDPRELIGRGLVKIILSCLASGCIKDRHKAVGDLLDLSVYESDEPIMVNYSLCLPSSKKRLDVTASKMVVWEKNRRRMIVHRLQPEERATNINFMTSFARELSEGLLPQETADVVNNLCKMIQLGCLTKSKEDVVDILLTAENLELFAEDKSFLNAAFSDCNQASSLSAKRKLPCSPATPSPKKHR